MLDTPVVADALRSFDGVAMEIGGLEVQADRSGAIYIAGERTLVVADLHLEKGSAAAVRGFMLPPYDTRETLTRLAEVIARHAPVRIVALGDSLHDPAGASRLGATELSALRQMQKGRDWLWITGNHDPEIDGILGGEVSAHVTVRGVTLRHEPSPGTGTAEIVGHMHPAARALVGGVGMRLRCFAADGRRLVLPAFGAFAGGLNVLDEAFAAVLARAQLAVHLVGRDGVYPVAHEWLVPD